MQPDQSDSPLTIPQRVYDWYNARYNNTTYRAVREALIDSARYGQLSANQNDADFITLVMNLLINASLGRSGAAIHAGAEAQLMTMIEPLDSRLTTLARIHLANFDRPTDATQALQEARVATHAAIQFISEIPAWRGRVAYAWASAAMYLSHAAQAILDDTNAESYPLEKLDRALNHLQSGIIEAERHGVAFSKAFTTWIQAQVKARR